MTHRLEGFRTERFLWWLTVLSSGAIIWLAGRLPMVDLPVHAGQIALFRGLITGNSPWEEIVYVNYLTPYLVTYVAASILNTFFPVLIVIKVLISASYLGFVYCSRLIRQQLGGHYFLDWFAVPVFFGMAFQWGFLSFVVSAPIGLLFLWANLNDNVGNKGWVILLLGLLLLFSHGLTFGFFLLCAFLINVAKLPTQLNRKPASLFLPLLWLTGSATLLVLAMWWREAGGQVFTTPTFNYGWWRVPQLLVNPFESFVHHLGEVSAIYLAVSMAFIAAPWLMGLRFAFNTVAVIPLIVVIGVAFFAPTGVLNTWFVYERFALFFFPAYAWSFTGGGRILLSRGKAFVGLVILMVGTWTVLGIAALKMVRFEQESAPFEDVLTGLDPGERALFFPFEKRSEAYNHDFTYLHFASWYEAEMDGFVDPNLAFYHNMLVRFREGESTVPGRFERNPDRFSWEEYKGDRYRYFIIRDQRAIRDQDYFFGAPCMPHHVLSSGEWKLFERKPCA